MKTQPPTSADSGAAPDPGVDSTWIASTPAQMIGHPDQTLAPARGSEVSRPGEEMYETLDRPLSTDPSIALERTRPSVPSAGLAALAPAPPKIGRYNILRTLGEGGMGVVYAAYDEDLDRKVAIKVMRDTSQGTDARERMKREAQAMARLSHPNVVQVHDVGEHQGQIFVAMEFVKGQDLRAWLQEQPRSWQAIRDMYVQAGHGLAAAHAEGIVHRDFKPDNVLVGADGRARVADFGLAGAGGQPIDPRDSAAIRLGGRNSAFSTTLTMVGTIMGTPAYMSPEQHSGSPTDARSDQFSFCVALWSSLYHQAPFAGESLIELSTSVCAGELRDPPARTDVPAFIRDALARGLAVDPAARHPSIDALLVELTRDLAAPRPSRWRTIAAAVAAAAVLTAGGAWMATREREPTPEELDRIARLAAEAREASAEAHWVYPPAADPKDTSILRVVELERIDGPPARAARAESGLLRHEFAELLVALGDRYWESDSGRPFARDYYSQALVFEPENARARERGLYTPGQLAELIEKAERAGFSGADVAAAELLSILADADPAARDARLRAFLAQHGSASQREMVAGLVGLHIIKPPDRNEETGTKLAASSSQPDPAPEPEPEPVPEPEPEPPAVAAVTPPAPTPTPTPRLRPPKPESKPDTKTADPEPEEQLTRAAQDRARSDELVKEGEAARRKGDFAGAELLFNQALAAYSRNGAALMGLSDVEFDRGHFEQAVVHAERAVKVEPKKADFRLRLGDAYFKVLRYPDAKTQYEKAAELGHARAAARLDKVKEKIGE